MTTRRFRSGAIAVLAAVLAAAAAAGCSSNPAERKAAYVKSGDGYFTAGRYQEAVLEFRNAVRIDEKDGAIRTKLADSYARAGEPAKALEQYIRAADLMPENADLQLTAGNLLLAAGRSSDALARADACLARDSQNVRAHVLRGNALAGAKNFDLAVAELEEAIRLDPAASHAYASIGAVELARGRVTEAEEALRKAASLAPDWADGHLALANFYFASGRHEDARRSLTDALRISPGHELANRAMAALSIAEGRPGEAAPYLERIATPDRPWSVLAVADYYLSVGRPRDAIARLDTIRDDKRFSDLADERRGRAMALSGDRGGARALADQLLQRNARNAAARLLKAELLVEEGRREEALAEARAAAEADPRSAAAQYFLGKLYAARADVHAAETAFREVLKLNPRAAVAQLELAKLYSASSRPDAAVGAAREAVTIAPRSVEARLTLVRGLTAKGDLALAERELDAIAAAHPDLPAVDVQRGVIAAARNDAAAARAAFERALARAPALIEPFAGLVALDLASGDVAAAKRRLESRLAAGGSPALYVLAARVHAAARELDAAERFLRRAIEGDPTMLPAYAMLGQLYVRQRRLADARREFTALAAKQTRPVSSLTMLGMICQVEGDAVAAKAHYERVLTVDPNAAVAANNLAWMYAEGGEKLDVALQLARTAVAALPETAEATDTLGWVLYKKGLAESAIPVLQQTVDRDPRNAVYHYHLGLACASAGKEVRARECLRRALEISTTFDGAADARQTLRALGG